MKSNRERKQTKGFKLFLYFLYGLLTVMILRRSSREPAFWHWSYVQAYALIFYSIFVGLCTWIYWAREKAGRAFRMYLLVVYILSFLLVDFVIGSRNFYAHHKLIDHPTYHHRLREGIRRLTITDRTFLDHPYFLHVNSQGLRSHREIPLQKPEGHYRILVLGDSFTEGEGVNEHETFCFRLEKILNRNFETRIRYEVLNAGVDSYAPILEKIYLREKGIFFEPDHVLVFFDMSDLMQTRSYMEDAVLDAKGQVIKVVPKQKGMGKKLNIFLRTRFYFLGVLYNSALNELSTDPDQELRGQAKKELLQFTLFEDQTAWAADWQQVFRDLEEIQMICRGQGIDFTVVVYPWGHQVSTSEWPLGRKAFDIQEDAKPAPGLAPWITSEIEKRGIRALNLFPAFRDYQGRKRLYFEKDMHWTPDAHELVARSLADFFKTQFKTEKYAPPQSEAEEKE